MGRAAALLVLLLAAPAAAEEPAVPPPAPIVVADFEAALTGEEFKAGKSAAEVVPDGPEGANHALRWTCEAGGEAAFLILAVPPSPDLAKARTLRFRVRREGPSPGALRVRVESAREDYLEARVRGTGPEWTTMAFDLADLRRWGAYDPARIQSLEFIVWRPGAGTFLLDDIVLDAAPPAPPPEPGAKGGKPPGKGPRRTVVADFEREGSEEFADARNSTVARAPAGGKEKGSVLAWTLRPSERVAYVEVHGLPRDVRAFRRLRFRIRADRELAQGLSVRLETTVEDTLSFRVSGIGSKWRTVEILLPEMKAYEAFDPARVERLSFNFFDPIEAVVHFDDVVLEEGPGGWRWTPEEMTAQVFGEERARKVRKIATRHFDIQTDSAAASSKFPAALEKAYDFVKKTLGHAEMEERLPVYIFQSSDLYWDFCVRYRGWSRAEAEETSGHGGRQYFATYYQSPEDPTIVHELTHSIFHRTVGFRGGSWLQEGIAEYIEYLWQERSAAEEFAPDLRGGRYLKLREFVVLGSLVSENDPKGGARVAGRLYHQAAAFYEFLRRGPLAKDAERLVGELARTSSSLEERPGVVERVFGKKLEDLEKEWVAWGSKPPKAK